MFDRYTKVDGVVTAYQLQNADNPNEIATFTIWRDDAARLKYINESEVKKDVDRAWPKQSRTIFTILGSTA